MGSKLLAEYQPVTATKYYYTSDQINSTRIITNSSGVGVHAGKTGVADLAGRTGWEHATEGCIRTTEEAMTAIFNRFQAHDPLTQIIVND